MRRTTILRLALFAALSTASCVAPRSTIPPASHDESSGLSDNISLSERVVQAHNLRRAKAGLTPMTPNPLLEASAVEHARDMALRHKMSHRGGDGSSPFERIGRSGYRYRASGENVAYGFDDVDSVMVGWMKSPGHRRNILGDYSEIGVGRAIAKDGVSYWCVNFGTPLNR